MPELSRNKFQFKCMGLAARLCELCSIFVSIIVGFVTLTENMIVNKVVPAEIDLKLSISCC